MPRPAKFTEAEILDAALALIAEAGPSAATMAAIAQRCGAPIGSLYHRFSSRDVLLAELWLRTVGRFQQGFVAALTADDLDEGALRAARFPLVWARGNLPEAQVLLLYRREELAAHWPVEIGERLAQLNQPAEAAMREHARRRYGSDETTHLQRLRLALADLPYAAGRRYLATGDPPPPTLDALVTSAASAIVGIAAAPAANAEGQNG